MARIGAILFNSGVVVVGGGPAGLIAAANAARFSDVLVFEEHPSFGQPAHCGGLVGPDAFEKLAIGRRGDLVLNRIRGFVLHSPSGLELEVNAESPCAQVIDRPLFDQHLAEVAEGMGCRLIHRRVRSVRQDGEGVSVDAGSGQEWRTRVAIDAEGVGRRIARTAGFGTRMRELLPSFQVTARCMDADPSFAHVFFGRRYGGFMAYAIPISDRIVRVGCAARGSDPARICKVVFEELYGKAEVIGSSRWAVWPGGEMAKTRIGRILLVGDAAGHTKPTTGGGIVMGGMMAGVTGDGAGRYAATLDVGDLEAIGLRNRPLTRRLRRMLLLRRILSALSDKTLDCVFELLMSREAELRGVLRSTDFDFHEGAPLALASGLMLTRAPLMLLRDIMTPRKA
jgi:geranylgeranyl reductase family protein